MYIVYTFVFMSNKIVSYLILSYGVMNFDELLIIQCHDLPLVSTED